MIWKLPYSRAEWVGCNTITNKRYGLLRLSHQNLNKRYRLLFIFKSHLQLCVKHDNLTGIDPIFYLRTTMFALYSSLSASGHSMRLPSHNDLVAVPAVCINRPTI